MPTGRGIVNHSGSSILKTPREIGSLPLVDYVEKWFRYKTSLAVVKYNYEKLDGSS